MASRNDVARWCCRNRLDMCVHVKDQGRRNVKRAMQDYSGVIVKYLPHGSDGRFARMDAVTRTEPDIGRRMAVRKPWARMLPSRLFS